MAGLGRTRTVDVCSAPAAVRFIGSREQQPEVILKDLQADFVEVAFPRWKKSLDRSFADNLLFSRPGTRPLDPGRNSVQA